MTQVNIQKLLLENGINQKDLAVGIGVPVGSMNDMLSPKGKMRLKLHTVADIASFFKVSIHELIYGKEKKEDPGTLPPELQELIKYYMAIPKFRKGIDYFAEDIRYSCKREIAELEHGAGMVAEAETEYPQGKEG